jgi:uncharacterized protein (TIGR02246 family)
MKHQRMTLAILAAGLLTGCAEARRKPDTEVRVAAANKLDQAFLEAFNKGDAEALSGLYWNSPETVSFPPDALQLRGSVAIREGNVMSVAAMKGAKLEFTETHQRAAGDVVIGWGLYRITIPGANGKTTGMNGRYTDVKAERDGKWVYLMDHASVPMKTGQ